MSENIELNEKLVLNEVSRNQLISKSKSGKDYSSDNRAEGKNRFDRRKKSYISNKVASYNKIDMNKLFKEDVLDVEVDVHGETNDYQTRISFNGVVERLKKELDGKDENALNFSVIMRALKRCLDSEDILVYCSCLHKDTEIKLVTGESVSIENMLERYKNGERFFIYSVDENNNLATGVVDKIWISGTSTDFTKVTLTGGAEIITTPDHLYRLKSGKYEQAQALKEKQRLSNGKTVKSVEALTLEEQPVYDIKIRNYDNFLVSAGTILHNCPDFAYRHKYWASVNGFVAGNKETRPSDETNPDDDMGGLCKHLALVLSNVSWVNKVCSTIFNYINYVKVHYEKEY